MTPKHRALVAAAKRARAHAYCPYSRYPVGAAVLTGSGRVFSGANVENASYGLSLCAERVAVFNAVSRGEKKIVAVAVAARSSRPCGACRQVLIEFCAKDAAVLCVDLDPNQRSERVTRTRPAALLPRAFDPIDAGLLPDPRNLLERDGARRRRRGARR